MIDPERYELDKNLARPDSEVFVNELVHQMKWSQKESILDYGCGPGSIANKILLPIAIKTNSHVYGIDNNPEMVEHALLRYGGKYRLFKQLPSLKDTNEEIEGKQIQFMEFHLGDILGNFPFEPNKMFDKIFCIFVFHIIKDYREATSKFYRHLKSGGQFAFTLPSKIIYYTMYTILLQTPRWRHIFEKLPNYMPDWMGKREESVTQVFYQVFEKVGFKILGSKTVLREYTFESLDSAAEFGMSINPLIKNVEVSLLPKLKEEYRKLLLNNADRHTLKTLQQGGPARIEYEVLVMLLVKPYFITESDGSPRRRFPHDYLHGRVSKSVIV